MNDGGFMAVSPLNSNIVFATGNVYNAGYFIGVSHSSDGGTTWEHDTIALGSRGWAVAFDGVDANRVYVGGDSGYSYPCLLISTDLGATWTMSRTGLPNSPVNVLLTIPGVADLVYAGTNNGLFRSTDGGATWAVTSLTSQVRTLVADPLHPASVFAGTYNAGVHASTDGGVTWTPMNTGLTCTKVLSLDLRPGAENTLYAGTEGGSVFRTTVTTGIAGPSFIVHRSSLTVSPNPSRGTTCLEFTLPAPTMVRAAVYDHAGRLVSDLGGHSMSSGTNAWQLDTRNIPAGTYFVRLCAGMETRTARLTIVN